MSGHAAATGWLAKARSTLRAAEVCSTADCQDSAVSRAYFGCLYAQIAVGLEAGLLSPDQLDRWVHKQTVAAAFQTVVDTSGQFEEDVGQIPPTLRGMRSRTDYTLDPTSEEDVHELLASLRRLIDATSSYLSDDMSVAEDSDDNTG